MINFENAKNAHLSWKYRLRKFLNNESDEKLDVSIVRQDNQCDLGKWIYSEGVAYAATPAYTELRGIHADFHRNAARILEIFQQGDYAKANELLTMMNGDYHSCSAKCIKAIDALQAHIKTAG